MPPPDLHTFVANLVGNWPSDNLISSICTLKPSAPSETKPATANYSELRSTTLNSTKMNFKTGPAAQAGVSPVVLKLDAPSLQAHRLPTALKSLLLLGTAHLSRPI
jgi:hypothetical protein